MGSRKKISPKMKHEVLADWQEKQLPAPVVKPEDEMKQPIPRKRRRDRSK